MNKNKSDRNSFILHVVAFFVWVAISSYLKVSPEMGTSIFILIAFAIAYIKQEKRVKDAKAKIISYLKQGLEDSNRKKFSDNERENLELFLKDAERDYYYDLKNKLLNYEGNMFHLRKKISKDMDVDYHFDYREIPKELFIYITISCILIILYNIF